MASPMPVLPLVASATVCPGLSAPDRSASSMMPSASRSFTDPNGLKASILTYRFKFGGAMLLIFTTGVLPTVSRMLANLVISPGVCPTSFGVEVGNPSCATYVPVKCSTAAYELWPVNNNGRAPHHCSLSVYEENRRPPQSSQ